MPNASAVASTMLGYEPIVDRNRRTSAMRITAAAYEGGDVDVASLYGDLVELWPTEAIPVLLRTGGAALPGALRDCAPSPLVWLEVPPAMLESAEGRAAIVALRERGFTQVLGGRPASVLPPELLAAFRFSIIDAAEDRRLRDDGAPPAHLRKLPYAQAGVRSISLLKRCFETGANACIGWPFDDAQLHATRSDSNPDFSTVTKLLSMIEKDADASELEAVIRRDASLAYRLLRYINSAGFGLQVEVQSFRHAVMMLGYERLKRWLMLMLMTAAKDANMQPVMFASFRRGLFLETLLGADDDTLGGEVFILGVLSLLDKLFREPMAQLLEKLYVPSTISEALLERAGPYAAYLGLAESIEREPDATLATRIDNAFMTPEQCNRALIRAITVRESAPA